MIRNILRIATVFTLVLAGVVNAQEQRGFYIGTGYGVMKAPDLDGESFSDARNAYIQVGYQFSESFAIEAQYSDSTKASTADFTVDGIDTRWELWESMLQLNEGMTLDEAMAIFPEAYADVGFLADIEIETLALYGVYRSSGKFYIKAKAGGVSAKANGTFAPVSYDYQWFDGNGSVIEGSLDSGTDGFDDLTQDFTVKESSKDTEFSAGLGVGYRIGSSFFSELEYTVIDDVDYISLGINYSF